MLNNTLVLLTSATAAYLWLCAIVAPVISGARSCARERRTVAFVALALACAAALLWTVVPMGLAVIAVMLEPAIGLATLRATSPAPGFAAGVAAWLLHLTLERRMPRLGATFEAASAVAIVAAVDDRASTLCRVESLYRWLVTEGSRNVKTAPPPGSFEAWTSPPWRETIARTIDNPRPLPEGTTVPAREASAL
jgi:hypothetical protein